MASKQAKSGSTPSFLSVRDGCNQGYYESLAVSIPNTHTSVVEKRGFFLEAAAEKRKEKKLRDTKAEPVVLYIMHASVAEAMLSQFQIFSQEHMPIACACVYQATRGRSTPTAM